MKNIFLFIFLTVTFISKGQLVFLEFSGNSIPKGIGKSNQDEIEKELGLPNSDTTKISNNSFFSRNEEVYNVVVMYYNDLGLELICGSQGSKDTKKNKKILHKITWNQKSGILLNKKIECGVSKIIDIQNIFHQSEWIKEKEILFSAGMYPPFDSDGKNPIWKEVVLLFNFNESGVLVSVEIMD